MRRHSSAGTALVLGSLILAACGDDPTQPSTAGVQPPRPELAVVANAWIVGANMPSNRTDLASVAVTNAAGQSVVYAIGGLNPNRVPVDKVTAYNVATNTWTFRHRLPVPLAGTNGAGVINGKIYVTGGYSDYGGNFPGSRLYIYDPATDTWTRKGDIPRTDIPGGDRYYAMGDGLTGVINGKLYVVSGCFQADPPWGYYESCNPLFFRYNPATDRWTALPPPFAGVPAYGASVGGVIGGKLYVMAGSLYTRDALFAVYDPATNQWTSKNALGLARPGAASAALEGKLYVIGGRRYNAELDGMETLDKTIAYDPTTDKWTGRASLPGPRNGLAAARVFVAGDPRIELVGGISPGNNLQYVP